MQTPSFLLPLKAIGSADLYHIQGFMQLLMKPRNGTSWTKEDKAAIITHLKYVGGTLPLLLVFTLPGGSLLLPLLAWVLDRRRNRKSLSINPDSIPSPSHQKSEFQENPEEVGNRQ